MLLLTRSGLTIGIVLRETGAYRESIEIHEKCLAFESPELDAKRAGWSTHALKLLGDTYSAKGDRSEAQSYVEHALELATRCDMRPLMDQCRSSLALDRTSRAV